MKIRTLLPSALLGLGLVSNLIAGGEGWTSDFEAAKKQAAEEKKDLLIDFTGSDWCGWCIKLKEEVFSQAAFATAAPKDFVLVEIDFPQDESKQDDATRERNKALGEKYGVQGYPTIILTDATGRPYAQTGYKPGGPEAYLNHLGELKKGRATRDEAFVKAAAAEGAEKARLLAEGLAPISPELQAAFYSDEVSQVVALDPEDKYGFTKRAKAAELAEQFQEKFGELMESLAPLAEAQDWVGAAKAVDEWIAANAFEGELKQQALFVKLNLVGRQDKHAEALALLDEIVAIDPTTEIGEGLKTQLRPRIVEAIEEAAKAGEGGGE